MLDRTKKNKISISYSPLVSQYWTKKYIHRGNADVAEL